jgi:hypothetical protein
VNAVKNLNRSYIRNVRKADLAYGGLRFIAQEPGRSHEPIQLSVEECQIVHAHFEPRDRFIPVEIEEFSFTGRVHLSREFRDTGVRRLRSASVIIAVQHRFITLLYPIRYPIFESRVIPDRSLAMMVGDNQ